MSKHDEAYFKKFDPAITGEGLPEGTKRCIQDIERENDNLIKSIRASLLGIEVAIKRHEAVMEARRAYFGTSYKKGVDNDNRC